MGQELSQMERKDCAVCLDVVIARLRYPAQLSSAAVWQARQTMERQTGDGCELEGSEGLE